MGIEEMLTGLFSVSVGTLPLALKYKSIDCASLVEYKCHPRLVLDENAPDKRASSRKRPQSTLVESLAVMFLAAYSSAIYMLY